MFFVLAAIAATNLQLFAHDMWIEPTTFSPQAGKVIGVKLRVGQDLLGDPVPRDPALINQFVVVDSAGRKPVAGRDGSDPAGLVLVGAPGLFVIGYRSNASLVELPAPKFNQYLKEEGLDVIAAARARRNETGAGAREMFSRCAKSLVMSGPAKEGEGDRQLGFILELVAERPLSGALVVAISRVNPSEKLTARSDNDGRVRFKFRQAGMWLVKSVHMVPAPAGANAEWASYWASLTFEVNGAQR